MKKRTRIDPALETMAFLIWREAEPLGWNISPTDLARKLQCSVSKITSVVEVKGWDHRLRGNTIADKRFAGSRMDLRNSMDADLDGTTRATMLAASGAPSYSGKGFGGFDYGDE